MCTGGMGEPLSFLGKNEAKQWYTAKRGRVSAGGGEGKGERRKEKRGRRASLSLYREKGWEGERGGGVVHA